MTKAWSFDKSSKWLIYTLGSFKTFLTTNSQLPGVYLHRESCLHGVLYVSPGGSHDSPVLLLLMSGSNWNISANIRIKSKAFKATSIATRRSSLMSWKSRETVLFNQSWKSCETVPFDQSWKSCETVPFNRVENLARLSLSTVTHRWLGNFSVKSGKFCYISPNF